MELILKDINTDIKLRIRILKYYEWSMSQYCFGTLTLSAYNHGYGYGYARISRSGFKEVCYAYHGKRES